MSSGGVTITSEQGKVDDLQSIIGGSQYGADISQIFGTGRVAGNLVWCAKPVEHQRTTSSTQGGKGGGGEVTTTTTYYWYTCSFAVLLCRGPVYGVSKIWASGALIYDLSDTADAGSVSASNMLLANHLTIYTGTSTQGQDPTIVSDKGAANTPAYRDRVLLVFRDVDLSPYGNRVPTMQAEVVEYGQLFGGNQITPLKRGAGAVLSQLCQGAGIPPAKIDVSQLTDELHGITTVRGTYREVAQHILDAFAIRPVFSGNVLKFRPTNLTAVDAVITAADLGAANSGTLGTRVATKRKRDFDLPRRVTVGYADITRQDERNSQTFRRMAPGGSKNDVTLDLPMLLDSATAAKIAETRCFRDWVERDSYTMPLGPKYMKLDAGDILTVNDGATTYRMRAKKIAFGYNGQVKIDGVAYNPAVSNSTAGGAAGDPMNPTIPVIGTTVAHLLDLPALRDDIADARMFFAAAGTSAGWKAATIYVSVDSGVSYSSMGRLETKSVIGATVAALHDAPESGSAYWDDTSYVDVDMVSGTLESVPDAMMKNGVNGALVGDEIIQFGVATLIATKRYRLSRLLRGRRGTEWAMTGHVAGERFVLLSTMGTATMQTANRDATRDYKVVPNGQELADVSAQTWTWTAEGLRPFSPVQAAAARDGSNNIALTWIRRSRIGQEMPSGTDIPLGEDAEAYEVDVLDGLGNVVRTIKPLSTAAASYPAADQVTDFGSVQPSCRFQIYQLSQTVGRGRGLDVTL